MKLNDIKISTRLTLGFAAMAAMVALVGAITVFKVKTLDAKFDDAIEDKYPKIALLAKVRSGNEGVARALRNLFIMSDPEMLAAQYEEIARISKQTGEAMSQLEKAVQTEDGKAALARIGAARSAYRGPRDRLMEELKAGRVEIAKRTLIKDVRPVQLAYMAAVDEMIAHEEGEMALAGAAVNREVDSALTSVVAIVATALAAAAALAFWLVRSTTRPLARAVDVARAVAAGDLTRQFDANGRNETAQLLAALKDMQQRLAGIVSDVRQNAEGVATASDQIASGNSDLSARTESQASALEQTAASMEQLGSTVRANSDNAQQANQLALAASDVAVQGGQAVQQVVATMKGISDSSGRIADIIGVIDGIAFQTNILALNAAVEAARAGEQGRGFAVVAGEVRTLAQRSAEAAKEIKALITQSGERVDQGTAQVSQAGATIDKVVESIRRVTDIMGEISSASREQSAGVAQVGEAVTAMDQATQQNAALVEESAAAAESLKAQARELVKAVAVFKLDGGRERQAETV